MPLCTCLRCTQEFPGGRAVSRSTFWRHQQTLQGPAAPACYTCRCSLYPQGHYFRSKASLSRHRNQLRINPPNTYSQPHNETSLSNDATSARGRDDNPHNSSDGLDEQFELILSDGDSDVGGLEEEDLEEDDTDNEEGSIARIIANTIADGGDLLEIDEDTLGSLSNSSI